MFFLKKNNIDIILFLIPTFNLIFFLNHGVFLLYFYNTMLPVSFEYFLIARLR
jgi:hypothetical protein